MTHQLSSFQRFPSAFAIVAASALAFTGGAISVSGPTGRAANYALPSTFATIAVTPATVRLAASKVYDGTAVFTPSAHVVATGVAGQTLAVTGAWAPERREPGAGALFVPIRQPKSRLLMAMLEPQAPDSLAAWGRFNTHFERKEYMEDYVAEAVAREMLRDPAVKAEFERRLREDTAFAQSPAARLEFFYRRHPSWDERYQLYPVLRVDAAP